MHFDKIQEMMIIQNGLNTKSYNAEWLEKGKTREFDYSVAAGQEIGEFFNSLPYDWWTGSEPDRVNCITELVDAWHFIMSQVIIDYNGDVDLAVDKVFDSWTASDPMYPTPSFLDIKNRAKILIVALYSDGQPSIYVREFFNLCAEYNLPLDLLHARYVGKATLNKFRVANGYKIKQYAKKWAFAPDGPVMEDNYFLSNWVDSQFRAGFVPTQDDVDKWLTEQYARVINKPVVSEPVVVV
jgi:hypothetical protein